MSHFEVEFAFHIIRHDGELGKVPDARQVIQGDVKRAESKIELAIKEEGATHLFAPSLV